MNRKLIVPMITALAVASTSAMAAKSPAEQCARVVDTLVLSLFGSIDKAALTVCSGKTSLDEAGAKLADLLNNKTLPKAVAALRKAGTCDPDLNVTAGSFDGTVNVADMTGLIHDGSPTASVLGVTSCNGIDDP